MSIPPPRVEDLFFAASERQDAAARAAYLDEVCGRCTELRRRVEALLAAEPKVSRFLESPAVTSPIEFGPVARDESPGTVIGPYKLLERIGEGGMGVVYLAEQSEPVRRKVALKLIKSGMDTKQVIARFEAERQALAMMDHPHIAQVHDAGATESGRPFFVMELVRGLPITDYCDREQLPISERLELFVLVCRAVQHAHQKGIIHRDLKPANVLVTVLDGAAVPKVIDFGVAKATGSSLTERTLFTAFDQFIGSPLYMSPEQAELSAIDIDTRSDIYSLGVVLYELLTGSTPFDEPTFRQSPFDEVRRIIREQEPPRPSSRLGALGETATSVSALRQTDPRKLDHALRGELDWIVMKCLEKDRARRYETANGLARDLMRYLADQPVEACPPSPLYRFTKYARRNRAVLAMASVVSLALIAGATIGTWQAIHATGAEKRMAAALVEAEEHRLRAERHLYGFSLRQVQHTLEQGQIERAQERLSSLRDQLGESETSDFAWSYLHHLAFREIEPFVKHPSEVRGWLLSPGGRLLASISVRGPILLTDLASGQTRLELSGHTGLLKLLAFSPDGRRLASIAEVSTSSDRHEAWIWDLATGRRLAKADPFKSTRLLGLTFSSSGRRLLTAFLEREDDPITVQLFDLESNASQPVLIRSLQVRPTYGISLDPTYLAADTMDRRLLTIFDTETLQARWSVSDRDRGQGWPILSADGRRVSTDDRHSVVIWDTATGRELSRRSVGKPMHKGLDYGLSRDGRKLLLHCKPTRLSVFDLDSGPSIPPRDLAIEASEQHKWQQAVFSPDGSKIAVQMMLKGGDPGPVTIWDSATVRQLATYPDRPQGSPQIGFAPGGDSVFLKDDKTVLRWWFGRTRDDSPQRLAGHLDEAWAVAFSPDGRILASGSDDSEKDDTIKLWDSATGRFLKGWRADPGTVSALAFSPDGQTLASAALFPSTNVRLWDAATGRLLATLDGHTDRVRSLAFSPDGLRIASAGSDRTIRLWDGTGGHGSVTLRGHTDTVRKVTFSPDGRTLASASNDRTVRLWDVASGKAKTEFHTLKKASAVAFAPDGSLLASADEGGDIYLWDPATGERRRSIHGDLVQLFTLAFSPDGRDLAAAGSGRVIRIWDILTGQELLSLPGHAAQINALAFSPDGRTLASCSHDGAVKLWRTDEPRSSR